MKLIHKYKSGQSIIEVVIALVVVVALAISLVTASLVTQKTSRSASSNVEATKLVQENIEQIRIFRDRQGFAALPDGAVGNNTYWCLDTTNADPSGWLLGNSGSVTCPETKNLAQINFQRSINITNGIDPTKSKVIKVTVTWTDSSGLQTVSNTTVLSNCVSSTTSC